MVQELRTKPAPRYLIRLRPDSRPRFRMRTNMAPTPTRPSALARALSMIPSIRYALSFGQTNWTARYAKL